MPVHPLAPEVIQPRPLRRAVILGIALSVGVSAGALYLTDRMHEQAFVDAAERNERIEEAHAIAKKYALEGFPAWVVANPKYACPQRLTELNDYVNREDTIDPWGLSFQSYCHSGNTFRVVSAGPDRTHGTHDDIIEGT